jgi:hypothetical protein
MTNAAIWTRIASGATVGHLAWLKIKRLAASHGPIVAAQSVQWQDSLQSIRTWRRNGRPMDGVRLGFNYWLRLEYAWQKQTAAED